MHILLTVTVTAAAQTALGGGLLPPGSFTRIQTAGATPPLRTAAESLRGFLRERNGGADVVIEPETTTGPVAPAAGTIVLGTPTDSPLLARWTAEGRLVLGAAAAASDAYEIAVLDGCLVVTGASPRALLYGVYELQDVLAEHGGVPAGLRRQARPALALRLLHPRVRGGFGSYRQSDIECLARAGGNVAHLTHDWMGEKTFFSFVPCPEFPRAVDAPALEANRRHLRQYLDWCRLYGLDAALWLCELPCQGGPWVPEARRQEFLGRFPADCLADTGTYEGKGLCLAHPLVEQAYRGMIRRFCTDFPEVAMLLVFTLDSNGELCDPATCPRHQGVSKLTQYNRLLALMLEEGRALRPGLQVFSVGWGWKFRGEPDFLAQQAGLPAGAGLASLPDGEAWSFDRKLTDALVASRAVTRERGQAFLGYDIFFWGDDTVFPQTQLYDFPFGIARKLQRWQALGADGIFDQWGTQAEYVQCDAVALRERLFHPEPADSAGLEAWAESLARRRFGPAAAAPVLAAWQEIERAQQIQSDHAYYWHHLRPGWSGPVLSCPLTLEALQGVNLSGGEPPKPYGKTDYAPHRDDVSRATALGPALAQAAEHFGKAVKQLEQALLVIPPVPRSLLDHWYTPEAGAAARLSPRELLEQQLIAVRLQERTQRRMSRFFTAFAWVKTLPPSGEAGYEAARAKLRLLQAEDQP
jgi:hypothetical protein